MNAQYQTNVDPPVQPDRLDPVLATCWQITGEIMVQVAFLHGRMDGDEPSVSRDSEGPRGLMATAFDLRSKLQVVRDELDRLHGRL